MNPDKIVCYCNKVTNAMIKDAVNKGASTLEEVQEATSAGTVCGKCRDNIQNLIKAFSTELEN